MLSGSEERMWVSYVNPNPKSSSIGSGDYEPKNVWVVERDKLLFASWLYINTNDSTSEQVSFSVDNFHEGGLPETIAYFPNSENAVEGRCFAFMGGPSSKIVIHSDPSMYGRHTLGVIRCGDLRNHR